ncbi:choice-of-anchor Q domain-containing protein [Dokdonella sp.]|uniref:choice-of-anchor Q domain-containing protein n=1 Tax=Dokdonella sp. TaxID=2291710 RepID=UPI001B091EA0|nr:choice-of-anchor Q domain-containing protein [Dokdonella sp.]MBO9664814.1 hypothetical protein [Dokdonella sp.]
MSLSSKRPTKTPAPAALALAIALTLGLSTPTPATSDTTAPQAPAFVLVVTNCDDSGAGSLRDAVASAADGDTIDLTQLTCSTITLTSGEIVVPQKGLTIVGPGANRLSVRRWPTNNYFRILDFTNASARVDDGNRLEALTLEGGHADDADGGCIRTAGDLSVVAAKVTQCTVRATGASGQSPNLGGGAIFARNSLHLMSSTVSYSWIVSEVGHGYFEGGCVYAGLGGLDMRYSAIDNCRIQGGDSAGGAGAWAMNGAQIFNSTISNNSLTTNSTGHGAGSALLLFSGGSGGLLIMVNSTISGNLSQDGRSVFSWLPAFIYNSTIARNIATVNQYPAVMIQGPLTLVSTIIAGNYVGSTNDPIVDLSAQVVSGDHNLVTFPQVSMPADTLMVDPHLQYLVDNGGPTRTLALAADSPAIDHGSDNANLQWDQRGAGFPRVIGAAADIGAFEWRPPDPVFANGFDPPG